MPSRQPKRAQVLLSADQFDLLTSYARQGGKSLSSVVRETLEITLLPELQRQKRLKAVEHLASLNLPTDDWEVIEKQLESRWTECDPT